ncbi:MAG: hypothetical protein J6L81_06945 [Clostridia bacterium]|nr:hypothetical protein [Clostridia bacterium]
MSKKHFSFIGIGIGLLCIIFAFVVFFIKPDISSPTLKNPAMASVGYTAQTEANEYYGGDAYTGIQHASAQTANNVVAVNDTLQQTNSNLETINSNIKRQAAAQENNIISLCKIVQLISGFFLLVIGLLTILKHLEHLIPESQTPQYYQPANTQYYTVESSSNGQPVDIYENTVVNQ